MMILKKQTSLNPTDTLSRHSLDPQHTLFLDIETTGLSPTRNRVCLIGCAFLSDDGTSWQIRQWFDETGSSEAALLSSFTDFAEQFESVIHFNGRTFDLPFLEKRAASDGISLSFAGKNSIDLYRILTSRKNILGLPNYKQQTVEAAMDTGRAESTSGRDFVNGYFRFLKTHSDTELKPILLHNYADMEGLLSLAPVLVLDDLRSMELCVTRAVADTSHMADGTVQDQLYLDCRLSESLPLPIRAHRDSCYMRAEGDRCHLIIPLFTGEMKVFFADWRNYYYLPGEDRAIHKSISMFVDRSHRIPAKAQTCYERVKGTFLPFWGEGKDTVRFRKEYSDRNEYVLFDDSLKRDQKALSQYAEEVFLMLCH